MENKFEFKADTHEYFLNGIRIPGFSEIMKAEGFNDLSAIRSDVLNAAQKFGTAVHLMTALWDRNILNVEILDPNLLPYLEGYKKFFNRYKIDMVDLGWIEKPTYSAKWQFGVTPDRLMYISGKATIVEIKSTTDMSPVIALQTAAQKIAIEERTNLKIKQRWGLQLLPNDCKVEPYKNLTDEGVFLSALNCYRWKKENLK